MDELQRQQLREARALLEADLSHSEIHDALRDAIRTQFPDSYVWLQDVYDAEVIAHIEGKEDSEGATIPAALYRFGYVIGASGEVALGVGVEVRKVTSYEPVETPASESAEIADEFVPLIEKAVRKDGLMPIKIIQPGWGSSGYYKPEVLERDGPKVFTKGLHMYVDHPTPTEEAERPERSVKDLVATLTADAAWNPTGPVGPGLYAEAKVIDSWRPFVEELAPHIGLSIRGSGQGVLGEAEGRKGRIIEGITGAKSVDFVTAAGAGGQILNLFESARSRAQATITPGGDNDVDEKQLQEAQAAREAAETKLTEAMAENATLKEANARLRAAELLRESKAYVAEQVPAKIEGIVQGVWDITRARLLDTLEGKAVITDGALDKDATKAVIEAAVLTEREFLAKIAESGTIRGMGEGASAGGESTAALKERFLALGLSEEAAEIAARGR